MEILKQLTIKRKWNQWKQALKKEINKKKTIGNLKIVLFLNRLNV